MLSYIKKYPISLFIILTVIYLSFFKPPKTDLSEIPNLDKLVHICMYFGMSGMLWLEFLRAHRRDEAPLWHAWVGAKRATLKKYGWSESSLHLSVTLSRRMQMYKRS